MAKPGKQLGARERIIDSAERLFYRHGVRAVGIDRIIAEAGVAKMTLYNHFKSKDELILSVLIHREDVFDRFLDERCEHYMQRGKDPLAAFFATLKEWFESPGFRGCSFINAAVELADEGHPASQFSKEHKAKFRGRIKKAILDSVGKVGSRFTASVALLIEGAIVTAVVDGNPEAAVTARKAADVLLGRKNR